LLVDVTTTTPAPNATPTAQPASEIGPAHPRAILAIILVSYFLILLDNSIIDDAAAVVDDEPEEKAQRDDA
jgi:hypothetical protein